MTASQRYKQAYFDYKRRTAPGFFHASGGENMIVPMPKVSTANGLTNFIIKYLTWQGHRATRINVSGQYMVEKYKGRVVSHGYRPSSTRKGTADLSATIMGLSVMLEIKAGNDRPSEDQLAEQEREQKAGGIYEFIHSPEEFFTLYDRIIDSRKKINDWLAQ